MLTQEQIAQANAKLSHCRILLKPGYKTLTLRAYLPPKPGREGKKTQQTIAIGKKANAAGLKVAIALAKKLDAELASDSFRWETWGYSAKSKQGSDPIDSFLALKRSQIQESSINSQYLPVVKKVQNLPGEVTTERLVKLIREESADHTKNRKTHCMVLAQLAQHMGLDPGPIKAIQGKYRPQPVDTADLPTDEQIIEIWEGIGSHWQWMYGMMAAYGLRPHECFHVDLALDGDLLIAKVRENTKTGARIVLPLPSIWTTEFNLATVVYPNIILEGRDNRRLSERISLRFREKGVPHVPKALRHAYSCRGARMGIQPDVMARMMGHSIQVHCQTYQNALGLSVYREVFRRAEQESSG